MAKTVLIYGVSKDTPIIANGVKLSFLGELNTLALAAEGSIVFNDGKVSFVDENGKSYTLVQKGVVAINRSDNVGGITRVKTGNAVPKPEVKLANLTPHDITIVRDGGNIVIPASGSLARVSAKTETIGELDGIPITETVFGEVEGLPAPEDGVAYIVSSLVAGRVPERSDVFIPNESIRNENGRIIGCKSLGRI